MSEAARPGARRKADVLARLSAPVADCWVATAGGDLPHLVPLTMAWHQDRVVLATASSSPTVRNLTRSAQVRVALGPTRDVILIEAVLDELIVVTRAEAGFVGAAYAAQNDWDPRAAGDGYVFVLLRPVLIQAWREQNELRDRTVMRDGVWLF